MNLLRRVAALLPEAWQYEMKRFFYKYQIRRSIFTSEEPEYSILSTIIASGDWVIDVGANVGHYTKRLSELVGPHGRVLAIEPVPDTFALLAANVQLFTFRNVTLINAAASDRSGVVGMAIPTASTGLKNFYQARIAAEELCFRNLKVMTIRIDSLAIPGRVTLAKIDVEGHESAVLRGMERLLRRDLPTLIIETNSRQVVEWLTGFGYGCERIKQSPNMIFRPIAPKRTKIENLSG
ncbi:MAG: FkbM family methyltransferase [Candidatus Omnitrophica bacterium]|nr:FkbM family methyltransferase [Candidatus Omnitrophota bacterium]